MTDLDRLEAQSVFILREACQRLRRIGLLWSLGKDSNVLLWLARKAFLGALPFPVLHVDAGREFPEMYAFRGRVCGALGPGPRGRHLPAGRGDGSYPAARR